ncbi:MAG: DUF3025 domain-containing protein [Lysobacteraceae bacterium]|nr:MAG: DUF3025 domain-containing protein [Xanthomonadaceae bacterium]
MAKRRFIAPPRTQVDPARFAHPLFAGFSVCHRWFVSAEWPAIETLNAMMPVCGLRFVRQDRGLLDDDLHYELRIAERGAIATRDGNWHDLFNAAVWCRYPMIKQAINARQVGHIAEMGPARRNRAQYALTQFDEAGAIVRVRDPALLARWDRHDWAGLFEDCADAWRDGGIVVVAVIGHALLEHGLLPEIQPVAKCVVVTGEADDEPCVEAVARAIIDGRLLNDPLELRPLPLAGIPGWHPEQNSAFYCSAASFQPARVGRTYPPGLAWPV